MKRRGFTLIEMLVVIAIIATLMGVMLASVSKFIKSADKARCQELVANTATALTALYQKEGCWPKALIKGHNGNHLLDENAALPLAKGRYMTLTMNSSETQLSGYDRFGVISPWAFSVIKNHGTSASLSTKVPGGGTIQDHVLRYALDLDGDGVIEGVPVGGETIDIRATAAVWCCGKDGKFETYSSGLRKDDVYSWTIGQTREVRK
ncbi:MAG: prepilin-type N-terminal cleavage/methylation domain-containing protein [Kiritimatiellae bacterium]|nr:prepilin-type N-terminal cleavage/methylation domain-containing protein [Kiritimatiellia bacterium]